MPFLEGLKLTCHQLLISVWPDPTNVPAVKTLDDLAAAAGLLHGFTLRQLFGRMLRDHFLELREMGVVIIAHWTDGEATWAVTEGADHAQQTLPKPEQVARS